MSKSIVVLGSIAGIICAGLLCVVLSSCPLPEPVDPPPAPPAPMLLPSESSLVVVWTSVSGATSYEVWWGGADDSADAVKFGENVTDGEGTLLTGLANGTTYYVWVKARNAGGASAFSPSASGMPQANEIDITHEGVTVVPGGAGCDFGNVFVGGESTTATFEIENAGPGALFITSVALDGPGAAQFELDLSSFSALVIPGLPVSLGVRCTPAAAGPAAATVTVSNNDADETAYSFTLEANAVPVTVPAPDLTPGNERITAGWTAVPGATAYEIWYHTSNNQATAAKFGDDIVGTSADITGLAGGTTYYVWLKAKNPGSVSAFGPAASAVPSGPPPEVGLRRGAVEIMSETQGCDFGGVFNGTDSPAVTFTIYNSGSGTLLISGISLSGAQADQFVLDMSGTNDTVPSGHDTAFTLFMHPSSPGAKTATVTITNNDPDESSFTLTAVGAGLAGPAAPTLTRGFEQLTAQWSAVAGAAAYEVWCHTADNSAAAVLHNDNVTGTSAAINGLTGGTPYYVWIKAKNAGSTSGFSPSAVATPFGKPPEISIQKGAVAIPSGSTGNDFGSLYETQRSDPVTFTIYNTGAGDLIINGITLSGTHADQFELDLTGTASTVAPAGHTSFQALFHPTTVGTKSAVITVSNIDQDEGTYTMMVYGEAAVAPGVTWTERTVSGAMGGSNWRGICSSADGVKLAAVNSTENVYTSVDGGASWTKHSVSQDMYGSMIAVISSADGSRLAAADYDGYIYTSTNGGTTWTQRTGSGEHTWWSLCSSSDGSRLAAASRGYIYTSADGGATWTERSSAGSRLWEDISCSADGLALCAVVYNGSVFTSPDGGSSWYERTGPGTRLWEAVAYSGDGSRIVVGSADGGSLYTSVDNGVNWTEQTASGFGSWYGVSSSYDGMTLAAVNHTTNTIAYSTDGGGTWAARTVTGNPDLVHLASSSDGASLAVTAERDFIHTSTDSGVSWTARTGAGERTWTALSSSSLGNLLAATVEQGYIYTSTSSGASWVERTGAGKKNWRTIASSTNGQNLAAAGDGTYIYTSTNGGGSWSERTGAGSRQWRMLASSGDGSRLAAVGFNTYIYTSADGGATWTERTHSGSRNWMAIASSSDGLSLCAAVYGGYIYTSADGGATWIERTGAGSRSWYAIASSADGLRLTAGGHGCPVYASQDGGAIWEEQTGTDSLLPVHLASSAEGEILAAVTYNFHLYMSLDGGATWAQRTGAGERSWLAITISADGTRLAAGALEYENLFTSP